MSNVLFPLLFVILLRSFGGWEADGKVMGDQHEDVGDVGERG